jgi:hypothetical protein
MAILVGIDEAGYGPVLGPLVVSAAVFELPGEQLGEPMWDLLRQSVCKRKAGSAGRVIINDSKKLSSSPKSKTTKKYQVLQRSVLACLAAQGDKGLPESLEDLLVSVRGYAVEELKQYPWYKGAVETFQLDYDRDDVATAANALGQTMVNKAVGLLHLWSKPLLAGEFNRQVGASQNKATVLFGLVSKFIDAAQKKYGESTNNLQIVVDKQGGRSHYRPLLQRLYPEWTMKILKETDGVSSYQLIDRDRQMKIHFVAKGDDRHLPVALASMASKLVRELFMELLNRYFQVKCPGIKPTAGYYQDGQRFLKDLAEGMDMGIIPKHMLIRDR